MAIIQSRRDTAANWTSANPTLSLGEIGYETDTGKIKFGDGSTAWISLAYTSGTLGTSGYSGVSGISGFTGVSGVAVSGISGFSGVSGSASAAVTTDDILLYQVYATSVAQGTWNGLPITTSNWTYVHLYNDFGSAAAQNDEIDWTFNAIGGTYTLRIYYTKRSDEAIATWLLDTVSIGTTDMYAASTTYNNTVDITGVTLSAGSHTLGMKAATKNVSSTRYALYLENLLFIRTGA